MALVFATLLILMLAIIALERLFRPPEAQTTEAKAEEAPPPTASSPAPDPDAKAVAAISIAIAHLLSEEEAQPPQTARVAPLLTDGRLSPWKLFGRQRLLRRRRLRL